MHKIPHPKPTSQPRIIACGPKGILAALRRRRMELESRRRDDETRP